MFVGFERSLNEIGDLSGVTSFRVLFSLLPCSSSCFIFGAVFACNDILEALLSDCPNRVFFFSPTLKYASPLFNNLEMVTYLCR